MATTIEVQPRRPNLRPAWQKPVGEPGICSGSQARSSSTYHWSWPDVSAIDRMFSSWISSLTTRRIAKREFIAQRSRCCGPKSY